MPAPLEGWDLTRYRAYLRTRAQLINMNPRLRARIDESDLVQETLLKAADPATAPCRGQSDQERLAWLEAIQNNVFIDRYRAEHAQKRDVSREQSMRQLLEESTVDWQAKVTDRAGTPLDEIARKEITLVVAEAIQQLPPDQREAVMAREMLHLSLAEAAAALGKTEGQIAGHYRRGLLKLKELLREHR